MAEPVIRNLLYHVTPIGNYAWNIEQIVKKLRIFNGKKVIAVAQGTRLDPINTVINLFPKDDSIIFIPKENHPTLRETATFPDLLNAVKTFNANEITFYAHTKGVTRDKEGGAFTLAVRTWTELMYEYNLNYVDEVERQLFSGYYHCTGIFKRYGTFGIFPKDSYWHYSGTFFWFNNRSLFLRDWKNIVFTRYGVEAYLSRIFTPTESGCLFADNVGNLYDLREVNKYLPEHKQLKLPITRKQKRVA